MVLDASGMEAEPDNGKRSHQGKPRSPGSFLILVAQLWSQHMVILALETLLDRVTVWNCCHRGGIEVPGSSGGSVCKESSCNAGDLGSIPVGKIPWGRAWQPTPVPLPGEPLWTEEPGGLQSTGSRRVGHAWVTKHSTMWYQISYFGAKADSRMGLASKEVCDLKAES